MTKSTEFISTKLFYKKAALWEKKTNHISMSTLADLENGLIPV